MGCPTCGVVAHGHGRVVVGLIDAPAMGRPVRIRWRKRRWVCPVPGCPVGTFVEQDERIAAPRASLTVRACRWAIEQIRREHASVNGIRRQLGTGWRTVWESIEPVLQAMALTRPGSRGWPSSGLMSTCGTTCRPSPSRTAGRGPKELTGMVDLTRDEHGRTRARLLDLVPGRSGAAYKTWLTERGQAFRSGVAVATLDPFRGYKNAIDDELERRPSPSSTPSTSSSSPRRSSTTCGAGSSRTPAATAAAVTTRCTGSATSCAPARNLTDRQRARLTRRVHRRRDEHVEVEVAWLCAQQVRSVYHQDTPAAGKAIAEKILELVHLVPDPRGRPPRPDPEAVA
jgi:transposase